MKKMTKSLATIDVLSSAACTLGMTPAATLPARSRAQASSERRATGSARDHDDSVRRSDDESDHGHLPVAVGH